MSSPEIEPVSRSVPSFSEMSLVAVAPPLNFGDFGGVWSMGGVWIGVNATAGASDFT